MFSDKLSDQETRLLLIGLPQFVCEIIERNIVLFGFGPILAVNDV